MNELVRNLLTYVMLVQIEQPGPPGYMKAKMKLTRGRISLQAFLMVVITLQGLCWMSGTASKCS